MFEAGQNFVTLNETVGEDGKPGLSSVSTLGVRRN